MRRFYHMRSELMPYIYSSVWQTHNTMVPLNRSMFIDYGDQPLSFKQPQEFTFGDVAACSAHHHARRRRAPHRVAESVVP